MLAFAPRAWAHVYWANLDPNTIGRLVVLDEDVVGAEGPSVVGDRPRWVNPTLLTAEESGFRRSIDLIGSPALGALRATNTLAARLR